MKVALCLQGQPRNWKPSVNHLHKFIISQYDTDVFGHTWWDKNMIGHTYGTSPFTGGGTYTIKENDIEELQREYNFKKFQVDPPRCFIDGKQYKVKELPEKRDSIIDSLKSRYFSLKTVLTLAEQYEKEHNLNYDWIIISRYDISIMQMPMLITLHPHKIYVEDYVHSGRKWILNDMLIIVGKKHKYVHKNIYDNFDNIWHLMQNIPEKYIPIIKGTELEHTPGINGEEFIAYHLLFNDALEDTIKTKEMRVTIFR